MNDVKIKLINKDKINEAIKYIEHDPKETLSFYSLYPTLFLGCYLDDKLIGACYGYPFYHEVPKEKDKVLLKHISVLPKFRRHGYATRLLKAFEEQTKKINFYQLTFGSANEISDSFYLKNGYQSTKYMIRGKKEDIPANYKDLYKISDERMVKDMLFLYVACNSCTPSLKEKFRKLFNVNDVKFIFEKEI